MGVRFGNYHSKQTYGMDFLSYSISPPKAKRNEVSIPLRDGTIDLTNALTDDIKFENRIIQISLEIRDDRSLWPSKLSKIRADLHEKRMDIVFDDDISYRYIGVVSVGEMKSNGSTGTLTITVDAEPFKYDLVSSNIDWEWDTFDLENGVINEAGEIVVNGTTVFTLICGRKRMFPTFTVSADMTVGFEGDTYTLKAGSQKVYDIFLCEGENVLTFVGNGTVAIEYIGGSL